MPKALELRKVIKILEKYGIVYVTGKGRHPKVFDPQTKRSYPVKAHHPYGDAVISGCPCIFN
jgi:predicted RNA binding protein YcfA (HicA-like mRNA interferase family)